MKYLKTYKKELTKAERWDYDYHEPPVLIRQFDVSLVKKNIRSRRCNTY